MNIKQNQSGVIVPTLVIFMTAFAIIGTALMSYTTSQYSQTRKNVFIANAAQVAEAGIEKSLYELNKDESFTGFASQQVFFDNPVQGKGTYTTSISPTADSNARIMRSEAKVYYQNDLTKPVSVRKLKVTVVGTGSTGYSVHTGPGGLIMNGSANITNSDVYVNGFIDLNGSSSIGTNSQPVNVNVANNKCPTGTNPGPTYPQVCTSGEPITLKQSTGIYGTVCATGQTSKGPRGNNIQTGNGGQGLVAGCIAPVVSPPTYDRQAQINAVTTTGSGTSNNYVCNNFPFNRVWPANLKLTGDVTVGGSCDVVISGNVYVTGNFKLNGAAKIRVNNSLGTTRPVIIVDGTVDINGSGKLISNSSGTGVHLISFKSTAACNPNCTSVTGTDLKNSQDLLTVAVGGGTTLPGNIFQAYWSKIQITGSGNVGAAIGQTVDLSGAGTVTFGTILSSGSKSWTVTSYQQDF